MHSTWTINSYEGHSWQKKKRRKSICSESSMWIHVLVFNLCFGSIAECFHVKSSGSKAAGKYIPSNVAGCPLELRLEPSHMERCEHLFSRVVSRTSSFEIIVPTWYLQLPRKWNCCWSPRKSGKIQQFWHECRTLLDLKKIAHFWKN